MELDRLAEEFYRSVISISRLNHEALVFITFIIPNNVHLIDPNTFISPRRGGRERSCGSFCPAPVSRLRPWKSPVWTGLSWHFKNVCTAGVYMALEQ